MSFKIPLFDLNFDEKEEAAVLEVLRSKWISTGPKCSQFESKFAAMLGANHALSLANCTIALHLAMVICGIEAEDEVICPSLTFVATVNAIRYVGAIPVFADVRSLEDLTIDPVDIESKITAKTKAIVVMHYGGFACDMDAILGIAQKYNLKVIEDACHAPLSEYHGKKLGTIGDVGCFSFFSNKNISTGEGGMLVTNNNELFERAKLLRSHGMTSMSYERAKGHSTEYDVVALGYNYRMDDIRAAIGIVQLDKLKADLEKRAIVREHYISNLSNCKNLIIPFQDYREFSSNYIFPIILKNGTKEKRDILRHQLANAGIQTSVHYPAVHRFNIYQQFNYSLQKTDYVTNCLITLPMYSSLPIDKVEFISNEIFGSL
ncbi:MAG: DegT/DnrJ/EryC1/StrS family aminotransferase [Ignavibacteriales bacterium]|nr:MAG: DegT/DnrJ/EryC1/StrS family aminotransferase [Ignavibacteriaceae bacterium]MBW7873540.1 DegT/DnrJ/EryC1/StrS family aminotransferase [Ignavibacteria bacterium]MCZ2143771.1 DegT/DnrJ/EryC1/StrS family aminotransferase [Ignavibacteriales bacterium]MBV6445959.1 UDP-4-amino-4-deoxy-L-arabinose--oxoglutarate aminotransferase [Ignavibacteriaceae bacterium]MBZ0196212.1 DegT/DnrJ/EryC1/StrS family aminotransferase [Ignavibacteriaceae bacterium]